MSRNEKSTYLKYKFQEKITQTLLKKGEDEPEGNYEEENEREVILPEEVGETLNLSKMSLTEFPGDLLDKSLNVRYLYLEECKLTELPRNFFQKLPLLQWLDLRNNALTSLPTEGLKNHSNLQVILLQGNRIKNLPIELATIPSLKGLQTSGNPLINVPYDVVAKGFSGIIGHLKKLCFQNEILLPASEAVVVRASDRTDMVIEKSGPNIDETADLDTRIWDMDKLSQWRQFMKKKNKNSNTDLKHIKNEKALDRQQKIAVSVRVHPKVSSNPVPFKCGAYHRNRHRTTALALHCLKMRKTRLGYKCRLITMDMLQEKARKEALLNQMRETLEKQARKIQRMRDKEVLKYWRDHAKITNEQIKLLDNYQQYPSKDFANRTPFDVDPEFLNMLNRVNLYNSLKDFDNKKKRAKKPKAKITALDLERQMNEIMNKLQNLSTTENEEASSPRSKQVHTCNKMSKILDIQKTLKQLQTLNNSMTGITPLLVSKSKN